MSECNIDVQPGACRLKTKIKATMDDDCNVVFEIESECSSVCELAASLGPLDPIKNLVAKFSECDVYIAANDTIPHTACPIPCALMKALEVASDLGLKRDVIIEIR